ncbi:MAG: formate transporter FocA [Alphaproteobacteria bacterium]|nr:formate transporter FocA [Alphaproteobacteria bacterium]MCB9793900.1 formate transporter FocA [Alphaproteobacteria bacterium]
MSEELRFDAFMPPEMARRAQAVGVAKATLPTASTLALGVLAGAFIGLGAMFATVTLTGTGALLPFGLTKLIGGLVFCLGLILVVVAGAELFTGNNLIVMAAVSGQITPAQLLRNWGLVYLGNFVGAVATAGMVLLTGQHRFDGGQVGLTALRIAEAKCSLGFTQAVALGVLCNALVCLAVWLTFSARTTTDRVLAVIFPITAFVAAGFEHSVANMYFVPMGLLLKAFGGADFFAGIGAQPADFPALTASNFLLGNLLPVTLGNVIGGALLVGVVYWLIYLRPAAER